MDNVQLISLVLSVLSFLLPLMVGFKKRRNLLWVYIFTSLAFDVTLIILKWGFHLTVLPLANIYVLSEFLILSFYYYYTLGKEYKYFLHLVLLLAAAYVVQTLANGVGQRNGAGAACFYAIYLLYALLGFYSISKKHEHDVITRSTFFWANVALLLGSSGRVILFLFEDYLTISHVTYLAKLWLIYKMLNVMTNILFAIALSRKYE